MLHFRTHLVAAIVCCVAFLATPAFAIQPLPEHGAFQAQGLVTAVMATPSTGACGTAVGDTFSGIVYFNGTGVKGGNGATYRISLNNSTQFGIFTEIFPKSNPHDTMTSGSYSFGLEGSALATGTFATSYTPLDQVSFLAVNTLTYTSPVDGTTNCVETDQVTLLMP